MVKHIKAAQKFFNEHLGVPRFYLFEDVQFEDKTYRGQEANYRLHLAISYAGNVQIEIIEHLSGESIFKEFLERKGEGMHHLGFIVVITKRQLATWPKMAIPSSKAGALATIPESALPFLIQKRLLAPLWRSLS